MVDTATHPQKGGTPSRLASTRRSSARRSSLVTKGCVAPFGTTRAIERGRLCQYTLLILKGILLMHIIMIKHIIPVENKVVYVLLLHIIMIEHIIPVENKVVNKAQVLYMEIEHLALLTFLVITYVKVLAELFLLKMNLVLIYQDVRVHLASIFQNMFLDTLPRL